MHVSLNNRALFLKVHNVSISIAHHLRSMFDQPSGKNAENSLLAVGVPLEGATLKTSSRLMVLTLGLKVLLLLLLLSLLDRSHSLLLLLLLLLLSISPSPTPLSKEGEGDGGGRSLGMSCSTCSCWSYRESSGKISFGGSVIVVVSAAIVGSSVTMVMRASVSSVVP